MTDQVRVANRRRTMNNVFTVTVGTGDDAEVFLVHDFLLKQTSKFFQTALKAEWKEGQEKKVDLPEDKPEAFGVYTEWLLHGKITPGTGKPTEDLTSYDITLEHLLLADLYVLGEKLMDDRFCAGVMKAVAELCLVEATDGGQFFPGERAINTIFEGTREGSPIRAWLVDEYWAHGSKNWFEPPRSAEYCAEFLLELVKKKMRR